MPITKTDDGRIIYHALAITPACRVGELLVTRVPRIDARPGENATRPGSQEWTGRTWPNTAAGRRAAGLENARMNGCAA